MKKQDFRIISVLVLGIAIVALIFSHTTLAQAGDIQRGVNSVGGAEAVSFDSALANVVNTLLFVIGAVSVIMIIYGGFRYVTSAGEASAVKSAKDTIMYAVVGLVIALVAWGIADFVINALTGSTTPSTSETSGQSEENARDAAPQGSPSQFRDNRGVIIE